MKRTLNDNVIDLSKYRNLFLLYFEHQTNGEYTENNLVELANEIKKLSDEISHLVAINEYDYAEEVASLNNKLDLFVKILEKYFKGEWERAKNGK